MKNHYHTSVENLLIYAVATALIFHGFRLLGSKLIASDSKASQGVGKHLAGFFTFAS